jgi:hypothetical protein
VLGRFVPAAKAVADRRPGNAPQPDAVIQHIAIAIAIGFGHAANVTDPWKNTKARIKPHTELDSWLDLEPKPEAEPQAQPKANAAAIANSNAESLPDADGRCVAERLAEHGPARGRPDHDHRDELHAQQVRDRCVLQGRKHDCLLDEDCHCGVQRNLLNYRQ